MPQIYVITNMGNGKAYVGQTVKTGRRRFTEHRRCARTGASYALARAIRKHGDAAFRIVQWDIPNGHADMWERFTIDLLGTMSRGYNMTRGGQCITRKRRDMAAMSLSGHPVSRATREKISQSLKAHFAKHPQAKKPRAPRPPPKMRVVQWTESMERIGAYTSARAASAATGIAHSSIYAAVAGRRKQAGGFRWSRVGEAPYTGDAKPGRVPVAAMSGGHVIATFQSAAEAARAYNCCSSSIVEVCRGRGRRVTVAGVLWRYARQESGKDEA